MRNFGVCLPSSPLIFPVTELGLSGEWLICHRVAKVVFFFFFFLFIFNVNLISYKICCHRALGRIVMFLGKICRQNPKFGAGSMMIMLYYIIISIILKFALCL
ncbi:hypothetical protein R6Q59_021439 [Mikania micrantha]